jgi:hypothetical protein
MCFISNKTALGRNIICFLGQNSFYLDNNLLTERPPIDQNSTLPFIIK